MSRPKRPRATPRNRNLLMALLIIGGGALLLLGALAVLGGGRLGPAAIEVSGRPSLKIDQNVIDMGDVRLGRMVEASFVLANVGDRPLRLTRTPYVEVVEGC